MVNENDVRHVAALARLAVDEARLPSLVAELNRILEHMEVLGKVSGGERAASPEAEYAMPLREDTGPPIPLAVPFGRIAPSTREGFILVPRLATHESDPADA